jgi:hypothetical protein
VTLAVRRFLTSIMREQSVPPNRRCSWCDSLNFLADKACKRCGAVLPKVEDSGSAVPTIPKKVVSARRACAADTRAAGSFQAKSQRGQTDNLPSHFKTLIAQKLYARMHMTLILGAVAVSGVVLSKLLLELGVKSILARYVTAVVVSYSLFFLFIRIWLWYVSQAPERGRRSRGRREIDLPEDISFDSVSGGGGYWSTGVDVPTNRGFTGFGGGGDFGGGGATDEWGDRVIVSAGAADSSPSRGSSGSTSTSSSIDGDEIIVLIAFGILLAVIFGAGAYLVYQAPAILSEAAFEALLASGLVKASNTMHRVGWMGSVFKATRTPFLVLLVTTVIFGLVVSHYCPEATRLADIFEDCGRPKI